MDAKKAVEIAVKESLSVTKEKVLIVTDKNYRKIADLFFSVCEEITLTDLIEMPVGKVHGEEPPKDVADAMLEHDVLLLPVSKSLTHTNAVKAACKKGARGASMPMITMEMIERCIPVDYYQMAQRTNKLKDILDKGKKIRLVTKAGTDIEFSIDGRKAEAGAGMLKVKGKVGNLPAGEAYIAPVHGNGKYVIDGSVLQSKVDEPIIIEVENGFAVKISGGKVADELRKSLEDVKDLNAYSIAEIGIGTNDKAKVTGNVLEDEKVQGTAHIALGNSSAIGGEIYAPIHIDGVFFEPTIYVDDVMILENGAIL